MAIHSLNTHPEFSVQGARESRVAECRRGIGVVPVMRQTSAAGDRSRFGRGSSFGQSTTHMGRLVPKIEGGGAAGCLLLVFGITREFYQEDM